MGTEPTSKSVAAIRGIVDAGRPLIYVQSAEEDRVIGVLSRIAEARGDGRGELFLWSVTEGLQRNGRPVKVQPEGPKGQSDELKGQLNGPRGVLDFIVAYDKPGFFLLRDFHEFMRDAADIRRRLRDLYYRCLNTGKFAVICSPVKYIPEEINREIAFAELPRPDLHELEELVKAEADAILGTGGSAGLTDEVVYVLTRALQGLAFNEARHALRRAMAEHGRLDASAVPTLEEEKHQLVRKAGLVEYVPDTAGIGQIGGLDVLKNWLMQRRELFFSRESISSEIVPKGLLLMGVSGCGKSLSARAIADVFGLPLYRIDMVQVFSAGIGHAEWRFTSACRAMEEVAPAVLWLDEIENGISRQHQDDTGVLDRIFGFFLTWMQEKPTGLFVAATANRIDLLPPEMIRKGRFDQVFFIDLPDSGERREIFRIHLSRRGVDPSTILLSLVADYTDGWTGAEIEQAVIASLVTARLAKAALSIDHMLPVIRQIVPLSKTMKEQVGELRTWAFDRAVHASTKRR